jgi:hypothetical protein
MSDFSIKWQPPFIVMKSIDGATRYDVLKTDRKYRSGRPIVQITFKDVAGTELTTRQGMVLQSKRTEEYYIVCRTDAPTSYRPSQSELLSMVENCHVGMSELYD